MLYNSKWIKPRWNGKVTLIKDERSARAAIKILRMKAKGECTVTDIVDMCENELNRGRLLTPEMCVLLETHYRRWGLNQNTL